MKNLLKDQNKLGEGIRRIRKEQKISARELAEKIGVSANYIYKIERGEVNPSSRIILSVANVLGVKIDHFISDLQCKQHIEHIDKNTNLKGTNSFGISMFKQDFLYKRLIEMSNEINPILKAGGISITIPKELVEPILDMVFEYQIVSKF